MHIPLDQLISAIGLPDALKLVERFGGVRIYLPQPEHLTGDNPIAKTVGLDAAKRLSALWAQERPYLPRATDALRRQRDRAIVQDLKSMSFSQVALKYRLTERQVYSIKAAADEAPMQVPPKQAGLF